MKPNRITLSPSSRFLVIIATTIFVLQCMALHLLPFPFVSDTSMLTAGEHLRIWTVVALSEWKTLAILLLATWVGQLLRQRFPDPPPAAKWILRAIAVASLAMYGYGILTQWLPVRYFGGCIFAALIQGYLVRVDGITQHSTRELSLTCAALALAFLGFHCIERHQWLALFTMMPFTYYMLLLSHNAAVRRLMEKPWVRPAVFVLSVLSFICAAYALGQACGHWLSIHYLVPLWALLLQPLTVYPFIFNWRKNTH
ncbi:MAG: hypothetical protein IKU04_05535 [Bacteroidales bacterium]|nr:hypothetical protein [Bacteroidales bacterium]